MERAVHVAITAFATLLTIVLLILTLFDSFLFSIGLVPAALTAAGTISQLRREKHQPSDHKEDEP